MPSFQNAAPGAKSIKFVNALDPFSGFLGREQQQQDDSIAAEVTEQLDTRLRFNHTTNTIEGSSMAISAQSNNVPQQQPQASEAEAQTDATPTDATTNTKKSKKKKDDRDESDDDSDNDGFGSDYEDDNAALEAFRHKRLAELKRAHQQKAEETSQGHGQVRVISQDEFLPECTSTSTNKDGAVVVAHFFHRDFGRCQIMSHHLKRLAPAHLSCKFVEIDAEKAPFFVVKLKVQTLPTLIVFKDGQVIDRLVGFEGLVTDLTKPDEFPTSRLGYWLEKAGAIDCYEGPDSDDDDEDEEGDSTKRRSKFGSLSQYAVYDEDV